MVRVARPRLAEFPFRTRLLGGLVVILLPLVGLAAGAAISLQGTLAAVEDVVHEATEEIAIVVQLQSLVQRVSILVHDFLLGGHHDVGERILLLQASEELDGAFAKAGTRDFSLVEERELLQASRVAWEEGRRIAEGILAIQVPGGERSGKEALIRLHAQLDQVLDLLDGVHSLAQMEMLDKLERAHGVRRRAWVAVSTAFAGGLGAAILVAVSLLTSLRRPLRVLETAASRLGAGDLTHRATLAMPDEFGRLAEAFNAMAEKLARSQAALAELSIKDGLTGLYNHREFRRRLAEETERSWRYGHPFCVLMLDIDGFKGVNDTLGHLVGDDTLRAIAILLRRAVRPIDIVARYGGEEFAIILPETPGLKALPMAERLRHLVAAHRFPVANGRAISLTVSIGVACLPDDTVLEEEMIALADQALYAAKSAGRNCVRRWTPS